MCYICLLLVVLLTKVAFVCAEQLAAAEWWELRGAHAPELPPEPTLQDVMRDLVEAPTLPSAFNRGFPSQAAAGKLLSILCGPLVMLGSCHGS